MDSTTLVKSQPEWNKKDKLNLLNIQKVLSGLGFFFSIVECTNIFLTNQREANGFILAFGIITIFVTLLNILTLVWALKQTDLCNQDQDNAAESTDNVFSRGILFLNLLIYTIFTLYYFLYNFAQTDLDNEYAANHDSKDIASLGSYLALKQGWIDFLSISNILVGLFSVFTAYSLASSAMTHRLMVYILISFSLWITWAEIGQIQRLEQIYKNSTHKYTEWSLTVIFGIAIANIIFLVLTWLANTRKLRIAYLILGAFFLCAVAIQIPSTGRLFRDYRDLTYKYRDDCVQELGQLSVTYVEGQGCPNKYLYQTRAQCPQNPTQCFIDPNSCPSKKNLQQVWEDDLVSDPITTNVLGCVNTSCCGILINTYTRPILMQALLSLDFLFVSFFLAIFTFQLSSMDKGDKQLPKNVLTILTLIYFAILIGGIVYVNWPAHNYLNRKGIVTNDLEIEKSPKVIHIQRNEQLEHYLKNGCENFNEFVGKQTSQNSAFINAADNSTVTNLGDLENLVKSDPANNLCGTELCDGYIVLLRTPTYTQPQSGQIAPPCKVKFDYEQDENEGHLRVLAGSTIASLIPKAPTKYYNDFGLVGTQQKIENILQGNLKVCGYDAFCPTIAAGTTNDNKFIVRVLKVQLKSFGFGKDPVTPAPVSFIAQHKTIKHNHPRHLVDESIFHSRMLSLAKKTHAEEVHNTLVTINPANSAIMTVIIHDLEDDTPLKDVNLRIYPGVVSFSEDCDDKKFESVQPDFQELTTKDGLAKLQVYFSVDGSMSYSIYAEKDGYHTSCRGITFQNKAAVTAHGSVDLGLGKRLKRGQTRVVLSWDNWAGSESATDKSKPFDLDLWATFGQYELSGTIPQFDCHVGLTNSHCGGLHFHGDAEYKKNGKSSESITFKTLGRFDYLVYFNRFYKDLPNNPTNTNWASDISHFKPLFTYYSSESKLPVANVKSHQLFVGGNILHSVDSNTKFDVLAFCVKAAGDSPSEEAKQVPTGNNQWTNSKTGITYNDVTKNYFPNTKSTWGTGQNARTICNL